MVLARDAFGIFPKCAKLGMMPKTPQRGAPSFALLRKP